MSTQPEAIIKQVRTSRRNGYIWHTTGSGKTLTSFKTSQIVMNLPEVQKVVFVVDRKDLDYQTMKEFNPSVLKAREIGSRIITKMKEFIEIFIKGVAA